MPTLPGPVPAAIIAFMAGAGVLALEITGARVFIPWFGSSVLVWSNVIGVTLGAIAVGNFLGGRLADRRPTAALLATLLAVAALLTAVVPFEVAFLADSLLPRGLELSSAFALIGKASLLVAIVSLGPPLLLLGAATPFLVRGAAERRGVAPGVGLVSGAATLGSLVGTWAPVYLLVPVVGSRLTCVIAAGAVLLGSIAAGIAGKVGRRTTVLLALTTGALLVLALLSDRAVGRGVDKGTVLFEGETRYQYARVLRDGDRTILSLNEGLDSFHSMTIADRILTEGSYFDYYSLFPPLLRSGDEPRRILILGFAAGTIARQILALYGDDLPLRITGVELDPVVAALGVRYFGLPEDDRIEIVAGLDARVFLDRSDRSFDLIIVDTFADQIYVPFQMCSRECFESALRHLGDGGIVAANLSGFSTRDTPIAAILNTASSVFGDVGVLRVDGGRNYVMYAGRSGVPDLKAGFEATPAELSEVVERANRLGAIRTHRFRQDGVVLTDDLSSIEVLSDRDLLTRSRLQLAGSTD